MENAHIVIGDWGTSSLTATLCVADFDAQTLEAVDMRRGKGVKFCGDHERHFHDVTADWRKSFEIHRAVLAGMVGSSIGWRSIGYVDCPAGLSEFQDSLVDFETEHMKTSILAGAACINPVGAPDVMRGEEAQVLGWIAQHDNLHRDWLLCLPGTHTKWAHVSNGRLMDFLTVPRGELHQILTEHSILLDGVSSEEAEFDPQIFGETLHQMRRQNDHGLFSRLFSVRSRIVSGELNQQQAWNYLSALLIGEDIRSGLSVYGEVLNADRHVSVIGSPTNCHLYSSALKQFDCQTSIFDASEMTIAGLSGLINSNDDRVKHVIPA